MLNIVYCRKNIRIKKLYFILINRKDLTFFNIVYFRGYQQQDAHEFLRYMLDRLHTELMHLLPDGTLKDSPYISLGHKGRSSIVTSVFGGTLQSEVSKFLLIGSSL